jgi:hypothetical protein
MTSFTKATVRGGEVTVPIEDGTLAVGELMAVQIREENPVRVTVWVEGDDDSRLTTSTAPIPPEVGGI